MAKKIDDLKPENNKSGLIFEFTPDGGIITRFAYNFAEGQENNHISKLSLQIMYGVIAMIESKPRLMLEMGAMYMADQKIEQEDDPLEIDFEPDPELEQKVKDEHAKRTMSELNNIFDKNKLN